MKMKTPKSRRNRGNSLSSSTSSSTSGSGGSPTPGAGARAGLQKGAGYELGEEVLCFFKGRSYLAKIIQILPRQDVEAENKKRPRTAKWKLGVGVASAEPEELVFQVHYIRWSNNWDEWVSRSRLRKIGNLVLEKDSDAGSDSEDF